MIRKNGYVNFEISGAKFRELLRLFCVDLETVQIAEVTGLNRNTVNRYLKGIRVEVAKICVRESPFMGEVEVDESYFGARRVKGKRVWGAGDKTIVFGIFKRNGSVYTEIVPDCTKGTLQAAIRGKVSLDSVIHSTGGEGMMG